MTFTFTFSAREVGFHPTENRHDQDLALQIRFRTSLFSLLAGIRGPKPTYPSVSSGHFRTNENVGLR
jgi:hypothetical protein